MGHYDEERDEYERQQKESLQRYYDSQINYWFDELAKYQENTESKRRCLHMIESLSRFATNFNLTLRAPEK